MIRSYIHSAVRVFISTLFFAAGLLCFTPASAQTLSVTARADRAEMTVGEQATVDLVVRTSDIARTRIFVPRDSAERFVVVRYTPMDTVRVDNTVSEIHARMVITAWDSCLLKVGPIAAGLDNKRAEAQPVVIKINEPPVNMSKPDSIADIAEPWKLRLTASDIILMILRSPLFYIALCLYILAVLGFIIYRIVKNRQRRNPLSLAPPVSPLQRALSAIEDLTGRYPKTEAEYKPFYTDLSNICRTYLDEEAKLPAMEMTSPELVSATEQKLGIKIQDSDAVYVITHLRDLLEESDLVKFARACPADASVEQSVKDARVFLTQADELICKKRAAEAAKVTQDIQSQN